MLHITLPDGSSRQFDQPISVHDVAADIGAGLGKAALAGKVDGQLVDTSFLIEQDAEVAIITAKSDEALDLISRQTASFPYETFSRILIHSINRSCFTRIAWDFFNLLKTWKQTRCAPGKYNCRT